MTEEQFRKLALALPEAIEGAHMGHPDFRAGGKIFATLAHEKGFGMIRLPPDLQEAFVRGAPAIFSPVKGAWGRQGATRVQLKNATRDALRDALAAAWRARVPKALLSRHPPARDGGSGGPDRT